MSEPVVLTAVAGGICTITMNRPKALNALNRELTLALRDAVFAAEQNKDVRCVVLKGGDHFMAGGDLKWFHENLAKYSAAEIKVIFEGFIQEEARQMGKTLDQIRAWEPPKKTTRRRKQAAV